jgi:hypothetical protein
MAKIGNGMKVKERRIMFLSKTWLPARDNKERSTRDRRAVKCIANAEFQFIQIHGRTLT